jgi:TetR/AcrR family transcriptional regulator, cholesterol catabolism regulator
MPEMDEIKLKIILAANELFMKYGIRSVTMDDISRHLGMSKKTIYQSFSEKDELVRAVNKLHQDLWESESCNVVASTSNAIDELIQFSIIFRKAISTMNPSVMHDMFKYHRSTWEDWIRYKRETLRKRVMDTIQRGQKDGTFRMDINVEVLAIMRIEQVDLAFNDQLFPADKFSFEEVQMQLFDHFIYGCLTPQGVELYEKSKRQITERELTPIVK